MAVSIKQHLTPAELREYEYATGRLKNHRAQAKAYSETVRKLKDRARKRAEENRGTN